MAQSQLRETSLRLKNVRLLSDCTDLFCFSVSCSNKVVIQKSTQQHRQPLFDHSPGDCKVISTVHLVGGKQLLSILD